MMAGDGVKERRQPANSQSSKPRSLDDLTCEEEVRGIMKLAEASLAEFLEDEPDIYTLKDLRISIKLRAAHPTLKGGVCFGVARPVFRISEIFESLLPRFPDLHD
jgi:hypothetical protein